MNYEGIQLPNPNIPGEKPLRKYDEDLIKALNDHDENLKAIFNLTPIEFTSHGTPDTEFSVEHFLGRVPTGVVVCGQSAAGSIYSGLTTNTDSVMYLRSNSSSVVFKVLFF